MLLIADSGSTKTDWIAIDANKDEVFRIQSLGLNPSIIKKEELASYVRQVPELIQYATNIKQLFFYGAGCGTEKPKAILYKIFASIFVNATIQIAEDLLGAVYASCNNKPGIVCILGTGSNSCFFNGKAIEYHLPSLGYTIMDEASGNYFGKQLLRDYFYKQMPKHIEKEFGNSFNLEIDKIKSNLYRKPNPNKYLASFSRFMTHFKDEEYITKMITKGFETFFTYRIIPLNKPLETPIYFIGSIAYHFKSTLEKVARKYHMEITEVIQRPIENLANYHKRNCKL